MADIKKIPMQILSLHRGQVLVVRVPSIGRTQEYDQWVHETFYNALNDAGLENPIVIMGDDSSLAIIDGESQQPESK